MKIRTHSNRKDRVRSLEAEINIDLLTETKNICDDEQRDHLLSFTNSFERGEGWKGGVQANPHKAEMSSSNGS